MIDDGSFTGAPLDAPATASNALLVERSVRDGAPLFVAGPQVGYFFPGSSPRWSSPAPASRCAARSFPAFPSCSSGVGRTSRGARPPRADNLDLFVETLCDDDRHYLYRGQCEPMRRFFVGTLTAQGSRSTGRVLRDQPRPVIGFATVRGKRGDLGAAVDQRTRAPEHTSVLRAQHRPRDGRGFLRTMNAVEFSFNWFYADDRDIAHFSSGRLPVRAAGTDPALPTLGTGDYDWRDYLPFEAHARGINPPSGAILNWNNKPAADVGASDSNFSYGSVQRVDLLRAAIAARRKHTLATVTGAMNEAATQDLRVARVWPVDRAVLQTGSAPSARAEAAASLLDDWRSAGSSRLDRELDGKIDDPGAAVMDAAWPRIADAVMTPVLGRSSTGCRSDGTQRRPEPGRRRVRRRLVRLRRQGLGRFSARGPRPVLAALLRGRRLATCRAALWDARRRRGAAGSRAGPAPSSWRADATAERIRFASGVLPDTMRWSNRPPQQLMSFSGHRPR